MSTVTARDLVDIVFSPWAYATMQIKRHVVRRDDGSRDDGSPSLLPELKAAAKARVRQIVNPKSQPGSRPKAKSSPILAAGPKKRLSTKRTVDGKLRHSRLVSRSFQLGLFSKRKTRQFQAEKEIKFVKKEKDTQAELIQVTTLNLVSSVALALIPVGIHLFGKNSAQPWTAIDAFVVVLQFLVTLPLFVTIHVYIFTMPLVTFVKAMKSARNLTILASIHRQDQETDELPLLSLTSGDATSDNVVAWTKARTVLLGMMRNALRGPQALIGGALVFLAFLFIWIGFEMVLLQLNNVSDLVQDVVVCQGVSFSLITTGSVLNLVNLARKINNELTENQHNLLDSLIVNISSDIAQNFEHYSPALLKALQRNQSLLKEVRSTARNEQNGIRFLGVCACFPVLYTFVIREKRESKNSRKSPPRSSPRDTDVNQRFLNNVALVCVGGFASILARMYLLDFATPTTGAAGGVGGSGNATRLL